MRDGNSLREKKLHCFDSLPELLTSKVVRGLTNLRVESERQWSE